MSFGVEYLPSNPYLDSPPPNSLMSDLPNYMQRRGPFDLPPQFVSHQQLRKILKHSLWCYSPDFRMSPWLRCRFPSRIISQEARKLPHTTVCTVRRCRVVRPLIHVIYRELRCPYYLECKYSTFSNNQLQDHVESFQCVQMNG